MTKRIPAQPLSISHPEIAAEADGWNPSEVSAGSQKNLQWRCKSGHVWNATVNNRAGKKQGCPFCSGKRVLEGVNDLFSFSPKLAKEADGWDPAITHRTSNKIVNWKCSIGHKWSAAICNRSIRGDSCPICSGKKVLAGYNDLATLEPEIASQADGWDPTTLTRNSNKRVNWKCAQGHKWTVSINNRTTHRTGCPTCSGQKILSGFNDLATVDPLTAQQAIGWDPSREAKWSHKLVTWKCATGHTYRARIADKSSGDGCPFCNGKKVLPGFNDLETKNPQLAKQAFGWDPKTFSEFSNKSLMWLCEEGHKWKSSVNHRSNGRGCPTCAKSGFDPNKQGYLYFLEHNLWQMFQIGITNFPENRLSIHIRNGWNLIDVRGPMDGFLARQWETAMLRALKVRGADLANSKIAGKFDGFSEAWSKSTFAISSLKELMTITDEIEEWNQIDK